MEKLDKKHGLKSVFIVALVLAIFLIIIAIVVKINDYKKSFYKVDVKFTTNAVVQLNNKLPISDDIGKNYSGTGIEKGIAEYKEFTVTNPNDGKIQYEIYLTKTNLNSKNIRSNYIKLYLTDINNNALDGFDSKKITSFYDLYSLRDKPSGRLLYTDSLNPGGKRTYILRCWVADTYVLSNESEIFDFEIDVRLK